MRDNIGAAVRAGRVAAVVAVAILMVGCGSGSGSRPQLPRPSTSTGPTVPPPAPPTPSTEVTTSTSEPSTTTTDPTGSTTTTDAPSSTTTDAPTTTTTTTTVPPPAPPTPSTAVAPQPEPSPDAGNDALAPIAPDDGSSTPWGWIIAGVVAAGAAITAIVLTARRRGASAQRLSRWREEATAVVASARMLSAVLAVGPSGADAPTDPTADIERSAAAFDRLAAESPNDQAQAVSRAAAEELRGLGFAIEVEQLLRSGATPPTAEQLQQAAADRRDRSAALDATLNRVEQV